MVISQEIRIFVVSNKTIGDMTKRKKTLTKAKKLFDSISDTFAEIRTECEEYISSVLEEHGGSIDFDDYEPDYYVSVTYDGGNHPEYASNAFSVVNGVFINRRGVISLNIEDCSDYELEDINWEEVYDVANYIKEIVK